MSILNTLSAGRSEPASTQIMQTWSGIPFPTLTARSTSAELYAAMMQYYNAAEAAAAKLIQLKADGKAVADDAERLRAELEASRVEAAQLRERLELVKGENLDLRIGAVRAEGDIRIADLKARLEEMERASGWRRPVAVSVNGDGGASAAAPRNVNELIKLIVRWVGDFADPSVKRAVKQAVRAALQGANLSEDDFDF